MILAALVFSFWIMDMDMHGHQSQPLKTWAECQAVRMLYDAEGTTTLECYAQERN